jgi:hypothetical protein
MDLIQDRNAECALTNATSALKQNLLKILEARKIQRTFEL